jgi:hypothetical protein
MPSATGGRVLGRVTHSLSSPIGLLLLAPCERAYGKGHISEDMLGRLTVAACMGKGRGWRCANKGDGSLTAAARPSDCLTASISAMGEGIEAKTCGHDHMGKGI